MDSWGDTLWTKTSGGPNAERSYCVKQTLDGGFIIVGSTYSFGSGGQDVYVVKTDSLGETEWIREVPIKPEDVSLNVFPNPFNSSCKIEAPVGAEIDIFDINGGAVGAPCMTPLQPGICTWQPTPSTPSGIYLIKATRGENIVTKKVIYLK